MNSPNTWDRPDLDYRQPIPQQSEVLGTCDSMFGEDSHVRCPECINWKPVIELDRSEVDD